MSRVRGKPAEHRDTFTFREFPEYSYTTAQRVRLGRVEHWRKARDEAHTALLDVLSGIQRKRYPYVLTTEAGRRLSKRFAYIFGITSDELIPSNDMDRAILERYLAGMSERQIADDLGTISNVAVHKRMEKIRRLGKDIPFCNLIHTIYRKIGRDTRWPVAVLDERLRDALNGYHDLDGNAYFGFCSVPVFGTERVREQLAYFTWEKCKELKNRYERINTIVPAMLRERYGPGVDAAEIERVCTTQQAYWRWSSSTFWDCVDHYLQKPGSRAKTGWPA